MSCFFIVLCVKIKRHQLLCLIFHLKFLLFNINIGTFAFFNSICKAFRLKNYFIHV